MSEVPLIPGFTVQHRLAAGRHGGVWAGLRSADGWPVAIKVVQADRIKDATRFLREAEALASIEHEHVVRCLASGREDGFLWLAMDLAAGDLAVEVRAGPSDPQAVFEAGRDAAAGLAELHRRGLVHRDVSPANLLRMPDGRVVVGDFGLVRGDHERLTRQGDVIGTPAYLSPEQAAGSEVDARADIYALGAVLYALTTGQPPYQGDNTWGMLSRIAAGPFPDPRELQPELPLQLRAIILAATGLKPEDRYQEAGMLAEDCAAVLAGGIPRQAGQVRSRQKAELVSGEARPAGPGRSIAPTVLAVLAGLALGAMPGWLLLRPDPQERSDFATALATGDAAAWQHYATAHPGGIGVGAARRALAVLEVEEPATSSEGRRLLQRDLAQVEDEIARLRQDPVMAAPAVSAAKPAAVAATAVPAAAAVPAAKTPAPRPPAPPSAAAPPISWPAGDPPPPSEQAEPAASLPTRQEATVSGMRRLAGLTICPQATTCMAVWDTNLGLWTSRDSGASWSVADRPEGAAQASRRPGRKASWIGMNGFIPGDGPIVGWRSRNGGLTWQRVPAPEVLGGMAAPMGTAHRAMLADLSLAVAVQDPQAPRIWRIATLAEGASTWQQAATISADKLALAGAGARLLLLRGDSGTWSTSADLGSSWRPIPNGTYEQSAWCEEGSRLRFLSWRMGISVLDTATSSWTSESLAQPELGNITNLAADPRTPGVVFAVDERSGLLRTVDQGRTWMLLAGDRGIAALELVGRTRPRLVWGDGLRIISVDVSGPIQKAFPPGGGR